MTSTQSAMNSSKLVFEAWLAISGVIVRVLAWNVGNAVNITAAIFPDTLWVRRATIEARVVVWQTMVMCGRRSRSFALALRSRGDRTDGQNSRQYCHYEEFVHDGVPINGNGLKTPILDLPFFEHMLRTL